MVFLLISVGIMAAVGFYTHDDTIFYSRATDPVIYVSITIGYGVFICLAA